MRKICVVALMTTLDALLNSRGHLFLVPCRVKCSRVIEVAILVMN